MMTSAREYRKILLELQPGEGELTEEDYLWLTDHGNRLIEFTDGYIEVLPMPTRKHQAISRFLFLALLAAVQASGGTVFYAPLRLRVREDKHREPDLLLLLDANDPRRQNRYWLGADLVVEIVSPDDPDRDLVEKRRDYAEAKIPEYWIADARSETIVVPRLQDGGYVEHGVFGRGTRATSALLEGFAVDVDAVFAVG